MWLLTDGDACCLVQVAALNKKQAEILKALYLVMYTRRFQLKNVRLYLFASCVCSMIHTNLANICALLVVCLSNQLKVIKEHILEFSGIPEQGTKSREVLFAKIAKWKRNFIQEVMDVLGVRGRRYVCIFMRFRLMSLLIIANIVVCAGRPLEKVV